MVSHSLSKMGLQEEEIIDKHNFRKQIKRFKRFQKTDEEPVKMNRLSYIVFL